MPNGRPPDKILYAIVCIGRQGSTYLERLLDSHPQVSCAGEIYSPAVFKGWGAEAVERHLLMRVHELPSKAVGFKLSLQDTMNHPELLGIVKKYDYRIIRLTRNLLDQFISGALAMANDAWIAGQPTRGITTVETSAEKLEDSFKWNMFGNSILREATETMQAIDVPYEDLIRMETHPRIYEFLEVETLPLPPATERQRTGTQRDCLIGYDDLKRQFAVSRWADQFLE